MALSIFKGARNAETQGKKESLESEQLENRSIRRVFAPEVISSSQINTARNLREEDVELILALIESCPLEEEMTIGQLRRDFYAAKDEKEREKIILQWDSIIYNKIPKDVTLEELKEYFKEAYPEGRTATLIVGRAIDILNGMKEGAPMHSGRAFQQKPAIYS